MLFSLNYFFFFLAIIISLTYANLERIYMKKKIRCRTSCFASFANHLPTAKTIRSPYTLNIFPNEKHFWGIWHNHIAWIKNVQTVNFPLTHYKFYYKSLLISPPLPSEEPASSILTQGFSPHLWTLLFSLKYKFE